MNFILKNTKRQLILFFYALSYFTRLPIPKSIVFDDKLFHKANAYFPVIGLLIASLMIAIFYLCQQLLSIPTSLIVMLICSLLLTGALHEDGFADCCDGFGGGYNATQRLKIMKDSSIGVYAGIGLIILFLLKLNLLFELASINFEVLAFSLLLAHSLSRYCALCIMQSSGYVRLTEEGKVRALTEKLSVDYFVFTSFVTLITLIVATLLSALSLYSALLVVLLCSVITFLFRRLFIKNLGGYTGDCLGLTQQGIEVSILLLATVILPL